MRDITGDLLDPSVADYIVQQCNCLTVKPHGLSQSIETRYPGTCSYATRRRVGKRNLAVVEDRQRPGTIRIVKPCSLHPAPRIVSLFAQWRPGRVAGRFHAIYPESAIRETESQRHIWFKQCLVAMGSKLRAVHATVAFPFGIGCGKAGGNWHRYRAMIERFDADNENLDVVIVSLPGNK